MMELGWNRDLERAENTAIACSLKYCPDAILKGDWETLAKIYNGTWIWLQFDSYGMHSILHYTFKMYMV
jgi:hypothetical protein